MRENEEAFPFILDDLPNGLIDISFSQKFNLLKESNPFDCLCLKGD